MYNFLSFHKLIILAQSLEKTFITIFERVLNGITIQEINSLLSTIYSERSYICDNSQNNVNTMSV